MVFGWDDERRTRSPSSKKERELFHKDQRGKCMYCDTKLRSGDGHIDHKIPLARGGKNTIANKQLLCGQCNTRKGDMTDGEFRRKYKELLLPARQAKGPPGKEIKLEQFQRITKEAAAKAAATKRAERRRNEESGWLF